MDPYERVIRKQQQRRKSIRRWIGIAFLILLIAGIGCGICEYGDFGVQIKLNGESEIILPYGDSFEEPFAAASFQGKNLLKNPVTVPVKVEGFVDESRVGTYDLIYRARYGFWSSEVHRTVRIVDRIRPRILLVGNGQSWYRPGESYREEGYEARDNYDGDLTDQVQITRYHNRVIYSVTDSSGNYAEAIRELVCYDPIFPEIQLNGDGKMTIGLGERFTEPGFTATDNLDGDLTGNVKISGKVDPYHAGSYTLKYSVTDSYGNRTTVIRVVEVQSAVQPEIIVPEGKVIYLTFDDGPGPYTRDLLDILKKYDVKATFFVTKTQYMDLLKDIVQEGHSIGIHSVSHDYNKIYASESAYFEDLLKMQELIEAYSGVRTTLVRFPGGSSNTVSDFNEGIMTRLTKALDEMGFQYFDWNVNSGDAGLTKRKDRVVEFVIDGVKEYDVSIVLQHDIKKYSVEAVEEIIIWGLENGYRFLALDPTSPNAHHKVRN